MTRTTLILCDVCKTELKENVTIIHFKEREDCQDYDICEKCFSTKPVPMIIASLLSNRNPPYDSWSIEFDGYSWNFGKDAKP